MLTVPVWNIECELCVFGRGRRRHRPRFFLPWCRAREAHRDWQVTGGVATVYGALCERILSVALHSLQLLRVPAVSVHVDAPPAYRKIQRLLSKWDGVCMWRAALMRSEHSVSFPSCFKTRAVLILYEKSWQLSPDCHLFLVLRVHTTVNMWRCILYWTVLLLYYTSVLWGSTGGKTECERELYNTNGTIYNLSKISHSNSRVVWYYLIASN